MPDYAVLEDRYSGVYSSGKWLIVQDFTEALTLQELEWLNNHIMSTDEFYETMNLKWIKAAEENNIDWPLSREKRDNTLTEQNTRLDAVERTLQASDCYARWNFDLMPWLIASNDLNSFFRRVDEQREDEESSYESQMWLKLLSESKKETDQSLDYWLNVYQQDEH